MMAFLKIGFIGTGLLGRPMATHLTNVGHTPTLFDIDEKASAEAAASIGGKDGILEAKAYRRPC